MTPSPISDPVRTAREAALHLLDRGDHATERLIEKLAAAGHPEAASRRAVDRLVSEGWLDDEALARRTSRELARRQPASPRFIETKLIALRIDAETAQRVAREVTEPLDLLDAAVGWARSRQRSMEGVSTVTAARRIAAALGRRGFDEDAIETVLDRLALAGGHEMPDDAP